jgi:hypothetical protein
MERNPVIFYKTLVIGITVLFIGVGSQPAIAQPDIIDFNIDNMNKKELTVKINEIMQKYGHMPIISYYCTFILTFLALYITAAIVVVSYIAVLGFIFIYVLGFIGI